MSAMPIANSSLAILTWGALMACSACAGPAQSNAPGTVRPSIEVLALSRGRGVPAETSAAFQKITARVELARQDGRVTTVERSTIGLEGETRLCVVFRDRPAFDALSAELRQLAAGVDLLQLHDDACAPQPGQND